MNKNIWIINEYAGSPSYGMTFRHYYLAKEFNKKGYNTTLISASFSHFLKKIPKMQGNTYKKENVDGVNFLWIKVMEYSKSFDKKRVFKWFEFTYKLFFISKYMHQNPDVIICSPTAPFCIVAAYYLSKKHKAKLVFEVRDIWPLTLVAVRGFSKHNLFIRFMGWFESFALKKSDIIVSNLSNYSSHIKNLNIDRASHWVSNGIDLDEMQKIQALSKEILIPQEKFIVGYAGKIGVSNALSYLLEAAKILKHNTNIVFLIVGEGQEKENLKLFSKELENVIFIDAIKKTQVQSMLSHFDICYIGLQKEELFKYGISPNKLFDYMYSEKAILQAINIEDDIVEKAKCGICVEAQNAQAIADAIIKFYEMDAFQRETLGKNAKKYVLKHFTYDKLAEKYLRILKKRYN